MQQYIELTNTEINDRIRERIHNKLYRRVLRMKMIDGLTCEKIAEDVQRSPVQIQRIVSQYRKLIEK